MDRDKIEVLKSDTRAKIETINSLMSGIDQKAMTNGISKEAMNKGEINKLREILKTVNNFHKNGNKTAALNYLNKVKNELRR